MIMFMIIVLFIALVGFIKYISSQQLNLKINNKMFNLKNIIFRVVLSITSLNIKERNMKNEHM